MEEKRDKRKPSRFEISQDPILRDDQNDAHKFEAAEDYIEIPNFEYLGELPNSYGTTELYLMPRDPRWVFAYWDIDWAARKKPEKILLKMYVGEREESATEIDPDVRNWYVPVQHPDTAYCAEIGYYADGKWVSVVHSNTVWTPSDSLSPDGKAQHVTVPPEVPFKSLFEAVRDKMESGETFLQALARLQGELSRNVHEWSDEQRDLLVRLFGSEQLERLQSGSIEIDDFLRKQLSQGLSSQWGSEFALQRWSESSLFSGVGASWSAQPFSIPREFFFHLNAEIIFYGGTHPDAKVTIDGKEITLNADGTFRYHFKFPDGKYRIPIVAESPDKVEERMATLSFQRSTGRDGEVGHTSQPGHLGTPMGEQS